MPEMDYPPNWVSMASELPIEEPGKLLAVQHATERKISLWRKGSDKMYPVYRHELADLIMQLISIEKDWLASERLRRVKA